MVVLPKFNYIPFKYNKFAAQHLGVCGHGVVT